MVESAKSDRLNVALELMRYLTTPLAVGVAMREQVIQRYCENNFVDAMRCCRELYQIGLSAGNSYVQGVALHHLGAVYLGLGARASDMNQAADYFRRSAQIFRTALGDQREHTEGVAWFSIGEVWMHQWDEFRMDKWEQAIDAFERATQSFQVKNDLLAPLACDHLRRAEFRLADLRKTPPHTEDSSSDPQPKPGSARHSTNANAKPLIMTSNPPPVPGMLNAMRRGRLFQTFVFICVVVIFVLAHMALWFIMAQLPQLEIFFKVGYIAAWIGIFAPLIFLFFAGQLFYSIPTNHAAIINLRGRIWQIQDLGNHQLDPFVECLIAIVPLAPRLLYAVNRNLATIKGTRIHVEVKAEYAIADAARVWMIVGGSVKTRQALGVPLRVPAEEILKPIEESARTLITEIVNLAVNDESKCELFAAQDKGALETWMLEQLQVYAGAWGLQFTKIQIGAQAV